MTRRTVTRGLVLLLAVWLANGLVDEIWNPLDWGLRQAGEACITAGIALLWWQFQDRRQERRQAGKSSRD